MDAIKNKTKGFNRNQKFQKKQSFFFNIVMYVYVYTYIFDAMFIVFVYNMYSVEQRTED